MMATDLKRQMVQEQKESVEINIYNIVRAVDNKFPVAKAVSLSGMRPAEMCPTPCCLALHSRTIAVESHVVMMASFM